MTAALHEAGFPDVFPTARDGMVVLIYHLDAPPVPTDVLDRACALATRDENPEVQWFREENLPVDRRPIRAGTPHPGSDLAESADDGEDSH